MGSGKEKAHEAIAVAPAPDVSQPAPAGPGWDDLPETTQEQLATLEAVAQTGDGASYDNLVLAVADLDESIDELPPAHADLVQTAIKQHTSDYLTALSVENLQALAAADGFEHPTLVGLNEASQHPLVHWLDPAYGVGIPSKVKIQAKATQRYSQLAAGETIGGLTLADVAAAEAALPPLAPPASAWTASPEQVATVMAELTQRAASLPSAPGDPEYASSYAALLAAENKLLTADCADLGDSLQELKGAATQLVDQRLDKAYPRSIAKHLGETGVLTEAEASWLSPEEAIAVTRVASGTNTAQQLKELAADRATTIERLKELKTAGYGTTAALKTVDLADHEGQAAVQDFAIETGEFFALKSDAVAWGAVASYEVQMLAGSSTYAHAQQRKQLSTAFRAWAKGQKLKHLRNAAGALGLEQHAGASRTHAQNFIAATWDSKLDAAAIQASVIAKGSSPGKTETSKASAPKAKAAKATNGGSAGTTATVAGSGKFGSTLAALKSKLQAHKALANDLPAPMSAGAVASHAWGKGTPFSKGSHESSLHTGPDGGSWMFKPDKSAKGARAHAEAAASSICQAVGVPGVGVHVTKIGGRTGSIQPLVTGASNLSTDASTWSQADVDAMVQLHVAAWAVGDHDGHASNVLRGPSGGVFAIDHGQAFKFFGQDRLDSSWTPPGNYGTPVYRQAYDAEKSGTLPAGVTIRAKAALPVIKAFEALPDDEYRALLSPTATEGVKHGVAWVKPMRAAARKRLGKSKVTDVEIAEEFLRTAVDRKNSLRNAFASFFETVGLADASHLAWVK